jgi:hypothetical protein
VQQVDQFVLESLSKLAANKNEYLTEMQAVTAKATTPGVAIGRQLSAQDLARFNELRHKLILVGAEEVYFSKFKRDVHVIADTLKISELADQYEVKQADLAPADPRRFYFTILEALRVAQPRAAESPRNNTGIPCDPEGGLFFQESFDLQLLRKGGLNDEHLIAHIADIERLRTLYQLVWLAFDKGLDDVRATTWNGDQANSPSSLSSAISIQSNSMQQMWKGVVPYIDSQMPSEKELENAYQAKMSAEAQREYPVR